MIHILGDSHTSVFEGFIISAHYVTAYNLYDKGIVQEYIKVLNGGKLVLIFGELDCRMHIYNKCIEHKTTFEQGVDETIESYGRVLSFLKERNVDFAVFNVVPSGIWNRRKSFDGYLIAPHDERGLIHRLYHDRFNKYCFNYKVIDLWDEILDTESGHTKSEFLVDEVHLNKSALPIIIKRLSKAFNIDYHDITMRRE